MAATAHFFDHRSGAFAKAEPGATPRALPAVLRIGLCSLAIATLASLLGKQWWVFDLATHFRVQYMVAGAILIGLAVAARYYWLALGFLVCLIPHAWAVGKYPKSIVPVAIARPHDSHTLRVTSINVYVLNRQYGKVISYIDKMQPDLLVVLEAQKDWRDFVADFRVRYRHAAPSNWDNGFGILLFSRYPIVNQKIVYPSGLDFPYLVATLKVGDKDVTFIAVHPPSPRGGTLSRLRNFQLRRIAREARSAKGFVIAAGDFNLTPWSSHYRKFIGLTKLRNTMGRTHWQPTWPAFMPAGGLPIDHIFVGKGIRVNGFERGPDVGSDHYPVTADITLR